MRVERREETCVIPQLEVTVIIHTGARRVDDTGSDTALEYSLDLTEIGEGLANGFVRSNATSFLPAEFPVADSEGIIRRIPDE